MASCFNLGNSFPRKAGRRGAAVGARSVTLLHNGGGFENGRLAIPDSGMEVLSFFRKEE
jgi:hypothetical protein